MRTVFRGKRISGILGVLPERSVDFEEEVGNYAFPPRQTLRLQKVMGYQSHRLVKDTTATSDLCRAGLGHILHKGWLRREEIGGLVVATTCPDHLIPPVSNLVQGALGLDREVMCVDLSQGCVGFLLGVIQAMMMLEHIPDRKVVVLAADVLSRRTSPRDRNSFPLVGDGAGIAVVENCPGAGEVHTVLYNDGSRGDALRIPAGGSRMPSTPRTAALRDEEGDGNFRALDHLVMNGSDVFSFVQAEVPPLIEETLSWAGLGKEEVDWYLFHQPNRFMLRKLAEKLGLPYEKVPMDLVESFGNSSSACIPILAAKDLSRQLREGSPQCCLAAFGSGLSWGAMTMRLGPLDFCQLLETDL